MRTVFLSLIFFFSTLRAGESITSQFEEYRSICTQAFLHDQVFDTFRSLGGYRHILELDNGQEYADCILKNCMGRSQHFKAFEKLDNLGNPPKTFYPKLGHFSPTTLRYIVIADDVLKRFTLPMEISIYEIGGGFGGQCYILSRLLPFSSYEIFDLPEVNLLSKKMLKALDVKNAKNRTLNMGEPEKVDLLISNFAFSECDFQTQMDYFEKVILKADRGYMLYNQIAKSVFKMDTMSSDEFFELLKAFDMNPKIHDEPVKSAPDNVLITWDRTQAL